MKDECKDAVPRVSLDLKSRGLFTVNSAELGASTLMFDGLVPCFPEIFVLDSKQPFAIRRKSVFKVCLGKVDILQR